jgi:hypothetical protein
MAVSRTRLFRLLSAAAGPLAVLASVPAAALADDLTPPPCATAIAASLADRPGTGRTTSSGGAPCVALPGEVIVESGVRRQVTTASGGSSTLASGPLGLVRFGVARRLELAVAPPAPQSRAARGTTAVGPARGSTDVVLAAKYLVLDRAAVQASLGASYAPPTGSGAFTAGAPTYSLGANVGVTLGPKLSLATSQVFGTAIGSDASGANRSFFVYAPSFTLGYALDGATTLLVQDALASRQGPTLPAGNRGFVALQHALGSRLAVDLDYERNFAPTLGTRADAVGFGFVWIVRPARRT